MSGAPNSAASFHLIPQTPPWLVSGEGVTRRPALSVRTGLLANVGGLGGCGWLALTMIPAFAATLAGAIAAAVAVIRGHERGVFASIPILIGIDLAVLLIGELAVPHQSPVMLSIGASPSGRKVR